MKARAGGYCGDAGDAGAAPSRLRRPRDSERAAAGRRHDAGRFRFVCDGQVQHRRVRVPIRGRNIAAQVLLGRFPVRAAYPQRCSSNANGLCGHVLPKPMGIITLSQIHGSFADSRQPASPSLTRTKADRARNAAISRYFPHLVWSPCLKSNHGSRILVPARLTEVQQIST
jgi:hypothetical protein